MGENAQDSFPGKEHGHSYNMWPRKLFLGHFPGASQVITLNWDLGSLWAWIRCWQMMLFLSLSFFLCLSSTARPISALGCIRKVWAERGVTCRKDFFSSSVSLGSFRAVTLYLEFRFQLVYPALKVTGKIKVFLRRIVCAFGKGYRCDIFEHPSSWWLCCWKWAEKRGSLQWAKAVFRVMIVKSCTFEMQNNMGFIFTSKYLVCSLSCSFHLPPCQIFVDIE